MPADARRLGAHLPLAAGMVRAVERAKAIGANAIQVFGDNPTAWRRRAEPPAELSAFRKRLAELDIGPVAIHGSYLINLAGPEPDFFERSIGLVVAELRAARGYGARFVNVHVGSHRGTSTEEGIERVADGIARALAQVDGSRRSPRLVLENSAGGGWAVGATLEELEALAVAIAARRIADRRVGFCLDAAHLWGAGYRVDDPVEIDSLIEEFDRRIGLERLAMIHLNDSKAEAGSRIDRHEHIGAGTIGPVGLAHLLRHPRLSHVAFYIETPGMDEGYDAINMGRALDLLAGRPLAPLPPDAMTLAGSRARAAALQERGSGGA